MVLVAGGKREGCLSRLKSDFNPLARSATGFCGWTLADGLGAVGAVVPSLDCGAGFGNGTLSAAAGVRPLRPNSAIPATSLRRMRAMYPPSP